MKNVFASQLCLRDGSLVHGLKYVRDDLFTWCGLLAWLFTQLGASYDRSSPVVTCIACLVDVPTESI